MKKRGRSPSKSLYVAQALRDAINSNRFPINTHIPSELSLSYDYSVTRKTIQRSLKVLEAEGLIVSEPRLGWKVIKRGAAEASNKIYIQGPTTLQGLKTIHHIQAGLMRENYFPEIDLIRNWKQLNDRNIPLDSIAGAIIHSGRELDPSIAAAFKERQIPLIGIMLSKQTSYDTISCDHTSGVARLINQLIDEGKKCIGFIASQVMEEASTDPSFSQRRNAYEATMLQRNMKPNLLSLSGRWDKKEEDEYRLNKWIQSLKAPKLDAIFCVEGATLEMTMTIMKNLKISAKNDIELTAGTYSLPTCLLEMHDLKELRTVYAPAKPLANAAIAKMKSRLSGDKSPPTCTLLEAKIMNLCTYKGPNGLSQCES